MRKPAGGDGDAGLPGPEASAETGVPDSGTPDAARPEAGAESGPADGLPVDGDARDAMDGCDSQDDSTGRDGGPDSLAPDLGRPDSDGGTADADGGAAAPIGTFRTGQCPFSVNPGLSNVVCGKVIAPEDHATGGPRTVELAVVIVKGKNVAPGTPPLVYLAGGPGGAGIEEVFSSGNLSLYFADIAAGRDLVAVDQRGTGSSLPSLACTEMGMPATMPPQPGAMMMASTLSPGERARLLACHDRLKGQGIDLALYNTAESADDLDVIRGALGFSQWDVMGASYGTRLALEVMRRHPTGVRSVVLDSVMPPQVDVVAETPVGSYRALDLFFQRCEANAYGPTNVNLRQVFHDTIRDLSATPIMLPRSGVYLTANQFVGLVRGLLYNRYSDGALVRVIRMFNERDLDGLEGLGLGGDSGGGDGGISLGLHLSVMCREFVAFTSREHITAELGKLPADLRPLMNFEFYLDVCGFWDVPAAPASDRAAVTSPLPALVLAGSLDPATAPSWSRLAAASLPGSAYFEFGRSGHGVFVQAPCAPDLIADFLASPATRPATPTCLDD